MPYKRMRVFFSGKVQGGGFRYTTHEIASGLGLGGWVKNLNDGRVEVLCEGEEKELKSLVAKINRFLKNYIVNTDINWEEPDYKFDGFEVRF